MKALTGLQIFKYLPGGKKEKEANCKQCGFPTCMAFAMKLAKKEISIDKCDFASEELKALFEKANQIQQAEIKFGPAKDEVVTGNETVMFRHDKTFVNQTALTIKLKTSDSDFDKKLDKISSYSVERVGEKLKISAIALEDDDNTFAEKAGKVIVKDFPLVLISSDLEKIKNILPFAKDSKPLVYLKNNDIQRIVEIEKEFKVPVIISGDDIQDLIANSSKALELKAENIVLNLNNLNTSNLIENLTYIRRAAIEHKFTPLGFPVMSFVDEIAGIKQDITEKNIWASVLLCKYSNIVVLDYFDEASVYSLLTLRQNIYTDPQKPLQIEPKVYPIGEVTNRSPVFVTTNFSLTYFTVASEIEASGIPVYLVITPSDGMSVLTAWAASKFTGETIAKAIKDFNVESLVTHRKLVIPGLTAILKEEVEEELSGWKVLIGTNESVEIVDYLKKLKID